MKSAAAAAAALGAIAIIAGAGCGAASSGAQDTGITNPTVQPSVPGHPNGPIAGDQTPTPAPGAGASPRASGSAAPGNCYSPNTKPGKLVPCPGN